MYKIYINETPLLLTENPASAAVAPSDMLHIAYDGQSNTLTHYIKLLENKASHSAINLYTENLPLLLSHLKKHYKSIEAAGGLVLQPDGQALFIYRHQYWDLPKGKLDPGETPSEAAIREVQEETGLHQLELGPFICHTYHTYYTSKQKPILKRTHWYFMKTLQPSPLHLQAEEGIEDAMWLSPNQFTPEKYHTYQTISDVVAQALPISTKKT